jgi:hypothetical protein
MAKYYYNKYDLQIGRSMSIVENETYINILCSGLPKSFDHLRTNGQHSIVRTLEYIIGTGKG